jgi:hypothetical protein
MKTFLTIRKPHNQIHQKRLLAAGLVACMFAIGVFIGIANAQSNAIAILPATKGGTEQTSLASVMGIGSANKLATARNIALSGNVTGTASFDGASNLSISATDVWGQYDNTFSLKLTEGAASTKSITLPKSGSTLKFSSPPMCRVYRVQTSHLDWREYIRTEGLTFTQTSTDQTINMVFYGTNASSGDYGPYTDNYRLSCFGPVNFQ